MGRATLAVMAAQERRAPLLPAVIESLRPQVNRLHVFLNGWQAVPECVARLADEWVLSPENLGAERKLHWADKWDGVYLSVDDDIVYPADYVATMVGAVEQWGGRALVTAHGRAYVREPDGVHSVAPGQNSLGHYDRNVRPGRFVNHGGTGVMAWNAAMLRVPTTFPERNIADLQVAIWAQRHQVPIWLIPHEANWLKPLALCDPKGLFKTSQAEGHRRRNEMLRAYGRDHGWQMLSLDRIDE